MISKEVRISIELFSRSIPLTKLIRTKAPCPWCSLSPQCRNEQSTEHIQFELPELRPIPRLLIDLMILLVLVCLSLPLGVSAHIMVARKARLNLKASIRSEESSYCINEGVRVVNGDALVGCLYQERTGGPIGLHSIPVSSEQTTWLGKGSMMSYVHLLGE